MKKYLLNSLIVFTLILVVGCGKSNKLVGTWNGSTLDGLETTFVFKKNGSVEYKNQFGINSEGTYKIDGDKVTISLKSWDDDKVYDFSIKDNKLSLTATDKYSPSYKEMIKK